MFISRLEAREASAEYWIHSTGQFGGVHAFGYNSAESEPIWMKSGALGVHCWGLALIDFGRDLGSRKFERQTKFCFLSIK